MSQSELSTEIFIGDKLPRSLVGNLLEIIRRGVFDGDDPYGDMQDNLLEENAGFLRPTDEGELLDLCDEDGHLCLTGEAPAGMFEELEQWLIDHRIAFDRYAEGNFEYTPDLIQFRPGMGAPHFFHTTAERTPLIFADHLFEVLLRNDEVAKAISVLDKLLPDISELEPFTIVADAEAT